MDILSTVANGFSAAGSAQNLIAALVGAFLGTVVGVLPGLGPTAAMSLLLPATFGLEPITAIILLAGIWYGSQYGGSTTSILLNMPGEATSVVTAFDGYRMALKGRAGAALFVSAVGSFLAGLIGLVGLAIAASALSRFALAFGPSEYFAIAVFGMLVLFNVSEGSAYKAALLAVLGMMLGTIGLDSVSGTARFTFGNMHLRDGIDLAAVIMGVYGIAELIEQLSGEAAQPAAVKSIRFRDLYPTRTELGRSIGPMFRGSVVGFVLGLVPGPAGVISTFVSYRLERRLSRRPEEFGHGAIEGVAGPEAANNAVTSASMIPLLSLGLPFSAPAAVLLAGFMVHGVAPGPGLIQNNPDFFWGLIASMVIGNVALLILNLPLVGAFVSILRLPRHYILSVVGLLLLGGAYAASSSTMTLWIAIVSGVAAWAVRPFGFDPAPLVLGLVVGPIIERSLRQSLALSGGDVSALVLQPLFGTLMLIAIVIVVVGVLRGARCRSTP